MSSNNILLNDLYNNGIDFFCGVPDSLLADFSRELESTKKKITNIITPNEGNAVGVAMGYYFSRNKIPLVYMQNSGLGNAINPLVSLAGKSVWKIPMFLLIGWRGSDKIKDEPQHQGQGKITLPILKLLGVSYKIYSKKTANNQIKELKKRALKIKSPVALVFPEKYITSKKKKKNSKKINKKATSIIRLEAIEEVLRQKSLSDLLISTTGKISRELYVVQNKLGMPHEDLFVVGGMGHASSIALGILKTISKKRIFLLDGDGAFLMHMGIISLLGKQNRNTFYHILLNNESHESVGGQPTTINNLNLKMLAKASQYLSYMEVTSTKQFSSFFKKTKNLKGSFFLNVKIEKASFLTLPRPKETPLKNIELFKKKITKI